MSSIKDVTVITPYLFKQEIVELQNFLGWKTKTLYEEDTARIGSDLMYQKLWNKASPDDIFIMHADMLPTSKTWLEEVKLYVSRYPEAGMFGCKLLYPAKVNGDKTIIQSAGGKFDENKHPKHFGSGLDLFTQQTWQELIVDTGQYDKVREVAWTTFGGVYIRRELLDQVGNFDPMYEWSYNRDVDYCLEARKRNWKIYQIPVPILHFESKDNKRVRASNTEYGMKETRNLKKLLDKWSTSGLMETIDSDVS